VTGEDHDPRSLLNLYRRLIHLRRENEALAAGLLIPLAVNNGAVAAYLRRAGRHAVLVVANLGASGVTGLSIGSGANALAPGTYAPRNLLKGPNGASLRVGTDGQIRDYSPVTRPIAPGEALVLDLVRARVRD
jgi:glycosidase